MLETPPIINDVQRLEAELAEIKRQFGIMLEYLHDINYALAKPSKDWHFGEMETVWKEHIAQKKEKAVQNVVE